MGRDVPYPHGADQGVVREDRGKQRIQGMRRVARFMRKGCVL